MRGQELGARLEHLQSELEQAGVERQAFLREQEIQQQRWGHRPGGREGRAGLGEGWVPRLLPGRYQGLEQRLEAELQAAATSKEEALRELKMRALQLEQELVQVRLRPGLPSLPPLWSRPLSLGHSLALRPNLGLLGRALCWESG